MKLLSIIIPHYNSPQYLDRLLESIPNIEQIEVIVVDDNSTLLKDKYEKVKSKYQRNNVFFFTNSTGHQSAGACRNVGLDNAVGKWILFADADDYFVGNFYNVVCRYFSSEYDIVYFAPTSVFESSGEIAGRHLLCEGLVKGYLDNGKHDEEIKIRALFNVPWSKLFNSEFVKSNNIRFQEVIVGNDVMFSLKAGIYANKIAADDAVIYCCVRNDTSLTTQYSKEKLLCRFEVFKLRYHFLKENLNHKDFSLLDISSAPFLFRSITYGLGLNVTSRIFSECIHERIHIIPRKVFSLGYIKKGLWDFIKGYKEEARFINKEE